MGLYRNLAQYSFPKSCIGNETVSEIKKKNKGAGSGVLFPLLPIFLLIPGMLIITDLINLPPWKMAKERSTTQARLQTTFPIYIGKLRPSYLKAQSVKIVHLSCVNRVQFQRAQPPCYCASFLLSISD